MHVMHMPLSQRGESFKKRNYFLAVFLAGFLAAFLAAFLGAASLTAAALGGVFCLIAAWAAARRAIGTRYGEQDT